MAFDPDTFLAEPPAAPATFDPDSFLAEPPANFDPDAFLQEPPTLGDRARAVGAAVVKGVRNQPLRDARAANLSLAQSLVQRPQQVTQPIQEAGRLAARGATSEGIYMAGEGAARLVANLPETLGEGVKAIERVRLRNAPPEELAEVLATVDRNIGDLRTQLAPALAPVATYADTTRRVRENIRQALPVSDEFAGSLPGQLAQGLGQAAATLPLYVVAPLGAAASLGQIYTEAYDDALRTGTDEATAHRAALKYLPAATLDFAADRLIVGKVLKPIVGRRTVGEALKHIATATAAEGVTEGAQQLYLNAVAKQLEGYDPGRELTEDVFRSALVGAIVGGTATTAGQVLRSERPPFDPSTAQPETPAAPPPASQPPPPASQPPPLAPTGGQTVGDTTRADADNEVMRQFLARPGTPAEQFEARLAAQRLAQREAAPLAPATPAGQLPAPQGTRPTPPASLTSPGSPAPGLGGEAPSVLAQPTAVKPEVVPATPLPEYLIQPSAEMSAAQKEYDVAVKAYRAQEIGDKEFIPAMEKYKAAQAKYDAARGEAPPDVAPTAEPTEATTQTAYTYSGRRVKIPADQAPAPNQVTADQYAELREVKRTKGDAAYRKAWDRTIKANARLAKEVAKNADGREAVSATKRRGLRFRSRTDGEVDIIEAIQDMGGVPRPGPSQSGQFDEWETYFGGKQPGRLLVGKRAGGWDGFMQDLVASYPQFAHLEGAYASQIGAEVAKAMEARKVLDRMNAQQKATDTFMNAALTGKGRGPKETKAGDPLVTDELVTGDALKFKNQDFVVQGVDDAGNVVLQDGPRFGTQVLPPETTIYPDKGSVQKVPREDAMDWPEPEPVVEQGYEIADLAGLSAAQIAANNAYRRQNDLQPLRQATADETNAIKVAESAMATARNREYTPAVRFENGQIIAAAGHAEAFQAATAQGLSGKSVRGFVTQDGQFLSLLEVGRREMAKKQAKPEPVAVAPAAAKDPLPTNVIPVDEMPFNLASEEVPEARSAIDLAADRAAAKAEADKQTDMFGGGSGGAAGSPGPAASPAPDAYPENPVPADDPVFTQLPIQLPEMLKFYQAISGGKIPKIVEKIRLLRGSALGVFRHKDGATGTGEIELRADLFNLLSRQEKQTLMEQAVAWGKGMKDLNPEINLREAIQQKFNELVREAEQAALRRDPRRALHVFAHEIGHYVDWLPDKSLKRGNILGHIAALKTYLKGFIGEHPAFQDAEPPTANERAKLRRQAEKELEKGVREVVETIRREVPVYAEIPITADHITSILKSAQRDEFPQLYDWFAGLDRKEKAAVLRAAMKGIVDERAARMAARRQTGTEVIEEQVTRRTGPEPTPENIRARYEELLREELKRRGLISERDIKRELSAAIAWWQGTKTMPDYFKTGTEMLAETYSILLNNPAALAKRAPTFWKAWHNYMERRPEVQKAYDRVQDEIRSGNVQKQRVMDLREAFRTDDEAGLTHELARSRINWRTVRDTLRLLFDRQQGPLQGRALRLRTTEEGGKLLSALKNYLYRQTAVEAYARQLVLRVETELSGANLTHEDMAEFMFHQRIANGDRQQLANAQGWSPKLSLERLTEMETTLAPKQWEALGRAMEANRSIYEEFVVRPLKAANVLTPELMEAIEARTLYAPFAKAREAFNPLTEGTIEGLLQNAYGKEVSARIYRQIGYLGEIRNPYVALTQKAFSLIQFIYEQNALKATRDFLQQHEPGLIAPAEERFNGRHWVPRIVDTPRIGTLLMLDAGKVKGYYVPREIYETMVSGSPLERQIVGLAHNALAWPKALLTELNPGFWPVAFAKDLLTLGLQIPKGWKAWPDIPKAYMAARASMQGRPNPLADAALRRLLVISRADPRGEHLGHEDEMTRLLLRMGQSPVLANAETKQVSRLLRFWLAWKRQGQTFERTTKIAAMLHLDSEEFASMPEWQKKRLINELAGSPDFLEKGRATPVVEAAGGPIFFNPWLQGMRALKDAAAYDPKGFWTKFLLWFGLPAAAYYAFETGLTDLGKDPEEAEDERDMLRSIPERDKLRGFIYPLGWADKQQKKAAYILFPFPDQVRFMHAGWRKLMQTGGGTVQPGAGLESFFQYQGQDLPGQNPIIAEGMKWFDFAIHGRNPYDEFRGRPTLDEDVYLSGGGAAELAKQTAANVTGGIAYRYRPTVPGAPDTKLEQFLKLPGVSNLLGRWLRVSNAGLREEAERATAAVQKHEAGLRVVADGMIAKTLKGEEWSAKEMQLAGMEPYLAQHLQNTMGRKYAEASDPEWRLYLRASVSERVELMRMWSERAAAKEARLERAQ